MAQFFRARGLDHGRSVDTPFDFEPNPRDMGLEMADLAIDSLSLLQSSETRVHGSLSVLRDDIGSLPSSNHVDRHGRPQGRH